MVLVHFKGVQVTPESRGKKGPQRILGHFPNINITPNILIEARNVSFSPQSTEGTDRVST